MSKRFWTVLLVFICALGIPLLIDGIISFKKRIETYIVYPPQFYIEEETEEVFFVANGTPIEIEDPDIDTGDWDWDEETQAQYGSVENPGALVHWPKGFASSEEWYVYVPSDIAIAGGCGVPWPIEGLQMKTSMTMNGGTVRALLGGRAYEDAHTWKGSQITVNGGTITEEISLTGVYHSPNRESKLVVNGGSIGEAGKEPAVVRVVRPPESEGMNWNRTDFEKMYLDVYGGEWNAAVDCRHIQTIRIQGNPVFGETGVMILHDGAGMKMLDNLGENSRVRMDLVSNWLNGKIWLQYPDHEVGRRIAGPKVVRRDMVPNVENFEVVGLEDNKTLGILNDNAIRILYATQLEYADGEMTVRYTDDEGVQHEVKAGRYQTSTSYKDAEGNILSRPPKQGPYTEIITYLGDRDLHLAPGAVEIQID